jgi:hypothetical protein
MPNPIGRDRERAGQARRRRMAQFDPTSMSATNEQVEERPLDALE